MGRGEDGLGFGELGVGLVVGRYQWGRFCLVLFLATSA